MNGHMRQRTGEVHFKNVELMNYFEDKVRVDSKKTGKVVNDVLPKIEDLVKYISQRDKHFDANVVYVGSYTQGLGVDANRDYDISIVFRYNPRAEANNTLVWTLNDKPLNYDFDRKHEKTVSIFDPNVKIVRTLSTLPNPGTGYLWVQLGPSYEIPGFTFDGDLIPFFVQRNFGLLLQEAIEYKKLNGIFELSQKLHGPALTVKTQIKTDDGDTHAVSIDLAVIIRAQLPFKTEMRWPVPDMNIIRAQLPFLTEMGWPAPIVKWPSEDKIQAIIEKGINLVAKKEFFWQQSFAELEKLLVREIDKDGGCRKIVHRIMKSVYYTVCGDESSLSTYILKWVSVRLGERYFSCLQRLIDCSRKRVLLQYFDRRVNLLEGKDISSDVEKICRFEFSPRKT